MKDFWISVVSWKRTSCGRQLGLFCLHYLFVCCGWFSLSGRLRQDCQFPYALYLENMCWQPCLCLHLSYTSDLSSYWYVTQMLSCLFSFLVHLTWPWYMASYADQTVKSMQTGSMCVSNREVRHFILQTQPLSAVILAWFKGLFQCMQEKEPCMCRALRHSSLCGEW